MGTRKEILCNKKVKILIAIMVIAAITVGCVIYSLHGNEKKSETVFKESEVAKGSLIVGVTESGSVSIGNAAQTFDIERVSVKVASSTSGSNSSESESSSSQSESNTSGSSLSLPESNSVGNSSNSSAQKSASTMSYTGQSGTISTMSSTSQSGTSSSSTSDGSSAQLIVEKVYVSTGQQVKKGDNLVKLTKASITAYREELNNDIASANLALSQAKLEREQTKISADYEYKTNKLLGSTAKATYNAAIEELENAVTTASENLENAADDISDSELSSLQNKLSQAKRKLETGKISAKQTYEESLLTYNNADKLYSIATNGLDDDVDEAEETLIEAKQVLADFNSFIGDGIVKTAYAGTIMSLGFKAGDKLTNETAIATYSDADDVTISVSVSQEDIALVNVSDTVNVKFTAYEDTVYKAIVTGIETTNSNSSSSSTVNYNVTATISSDTSKIYSGMTGDVTFITKEIDDVLYVSNKAIIKEGTSSYVKIKKSDNEYEKKKVVTGFSDGSNVEITQGLNEGDTVIIESQVNLS